jgi:hypothetical protein
MDWWLLGESSGLPAERAKPLGRKSGRSDAVSGRAGEAWGTGRVLDIRRRDPGAERAKTARDEAWREGCRSVICERLLQGVCDAILGRRCLLAVPHLLGGGWCGWVVSNGRKLLGRRRRGALCSASDRGHWRPGEGRGSGGAGLQSGRCGLDGIRVGDGSLLELLHDRAHVGRVAGRRPRFIQNFALRRRQHAPDAVDELHGILGRPEVDVERMELVVVFVLVVRVVRWQMPLVVPLNLANG